MLERRVRVNLKTGLQARPAAMFVQEANRFQAEIWLEKGDKRVSAKSIMGVMSLAIAPGTEIVLKAEGPDADEALKRLSAFVAEENLTFA
ncbi:HPr family phosphocarrier protein [Hydrogenibacillus sp. N12]|uniref:HPr family phosphocarrier protein n=1 Tax=Hydrogenibacillus sp. N12 TaxID=2866627 RepID=UPI001C7DD892|nr:HPr family phosphocarrier protein [Hydrogenibacillus sp. N12]QZA32771.1 HPr family phosphocarrier protein [Hydrogenibacillus sp. N12]